ncbi:ribonuclease H-like domain-containing protein [Tanacetum coccineum]
MVPPNNLAPGLNGFDLKGYSDSDYAGCNMDRKITSSAYQLLGGKLMCWSAKKQQYVAMSLVEAEYVAAARCCANILWMKILHSRTKLIDIIYHFIRDHILKGDIELHVISTEYQLADIFTKPLDEPTFKRLIVKLELQKKLLAKMKKREKQDPPDYALHKIILLNSINDLMQRRCRMVPTNSRFGGHDPNPRDADIFEAIVLKASSGHFARECRIKGNQDNKRRDAWNSGTNDGSRTGKKEDSKALAVRGIKGETAVKAPPQDETSGILKDFIRQIENQLNQKVKTIRCDNGTEFKNKDVIEFCGSKGIKREYSNARTPQQNGVAERKNRTLIEAARTMLADSFLPNTFWAEAVSTACYVLNRVLVTKPHNKTPYELLTGKILIISYIRPFGCHVTILNTIDHLGKFAGKSDEGFLVGYSLQSKAFRVYNLETKRVEENLHITFLENKPNVAGKGPTWLFDLDYLTDSMNYHPVRSENQANLHAGQQEANQNAGTEDIIDAGDSEKEDESAQDCFVLPIWPSYSSTIPPDLKTDEKREGPREEEQVFLDELERLKRQEKEANEEAEALRKEYAQETKNLVIQARAAKASSTNIFSTVSTPAKGSSTNPVNTVSIPVSTDEGLSLSDPTNPEQDDSEIPPLEDIYQNSTDGIFTNSSYDDEGAVADFTNLETIVNVSPIPTSRIISSHPSALILGDPTSAVQTRSKLNKSFGAHAFVSYVQKQRKNNHKDFQHCLFTCFLSQNEPKKISEALWASFVDSKSNVRLWVQLHGHKDLH